MGRKVEVLDIIKKEAAKNEEILKESIVNLFVSYYKNNLHKKVDNDG
ncbi:hypothetical protein [Lysinibacillus fusiformis]|nr:hypothetical protein QYY55_10355 [Lysinibacillus fusiformis]